MTVKETLVEALRAEGYDFFTACEIASATIREFLTSGKKEQLVGIARQQFRLARKEARK
jgi:hypothetical protein